jgi:aryl-alcohol dehydrogenase-like predicted oxidoreductase
MGMSQMRQIGPFQVAPIGLGCMGFNHAYGTPVPEAQAQAVLLRALERGVTLFDTAALYGFGLNEELVGRILRPYRDRIVLASKGGMIGVDGKRVIDGRPQALVQHCEDSLRRLGTDCIDLYYLHRWDKAVPVEESMGALSRLVEQGKVRALGLSEVSALTLAKAQAVHPVAAVQTEYSLWTRNPEIALLQACRRDGVALVAFSPLGRGVLTGRLRDPAQLVPGDIRKAMPRFKPENFPANLALVDELAALASQAGCTPAQLALAWLLERDPAVVPIPGTTSTVHLDELLDTLALLPPAGLLEQAGRILGEHSVAGNRYPDGTQAEIDTEQF